MVEKTLNRILDSWKPQFEKHWSSQNTNELLLSSFTPSNFCHLMKMQAYLIPKILEKNLEIDRLYNSLRLETPFHLLNMDSGRISQQSEQSHPG